MALAQVDSHPASEPSHRPPALPTPAERPGEAIVIYDGDCRICTAQIQRLSRWDRGRRLAYLSLHDPEVAQRFPDLSYDQLMAQMYVVDPQGARHGGVEALKYLSRTLPTLWWLVPVLHFPGSRPLWAWAYRHVAESRYRWGRLNECSDGACQVHFRR